MLSAQKKIIKGIFYFDPNDRIYEDHFPSNPVTPGSVIIHAFLKAVKESGTTISAFEAKNFKFKRFINPGEYAYKIKIDSNNLKCTLYDSNEKIAATGEIVI